MRSNMSITPGARIGRYESQLTNRPGRYGSCLPRTRYQTTAERCRLRTCWKSRDKLRPDEMDRHLFRIGFTEEVHKETNVDRRTINVTSPTVNAQQSTDNDLGLAPPFCATQKPRP